MVTFAYLAHQTTTLCPRALPPTHVRKMSAQLSQPGHGFTPPSAMSAEPAVPYIRVRLQQFEPVTPLKALKANYIGKFIAVKGACVHPCRTFKHL
jgi:hypothetical protein